MPALNDWVWIKPNADSSSAPDPVEFARAVWKTIIAEATKAGTELTPIERAAPFRDRNVLSDVDIAAILGKPLRWVQDKARAESEDLPIPLYGSNHKRGETRLWSAKAFFRWLDSNGKARR